MIYLDYNATTPLDPRVLEAMMPFLEDEFGNAASPHHALGRSAAAAVQAARERTAAVIGADEREIVWTSGATESDNLALAGTAASPAYRRRRHLVTVPTEHSAVLDTVRHLEQHGFDVTWLAVDRTGRIDLDELRSAIRDDTLLVSVMHANNEIGVLQDIGAIGAICRERGTLFHTDATQSFGKEPIEVNADCIDLLSLSAHKMCGPKGVGALYVRRRGPRVRCEPLLHGGGHERGMRSGTLNVPGIVGLGYAAELCSVERAGEQPRVRGLRDLLETGLTTVRATVHGADAPRLAGTSNISFPGVEAEALLEALPELALATASACTSAARQPSYVLGALGLDDAAVRGSVRFSLGRFTTASEVERALELVVAAVRAS